MDTTENCFSSQSSKKSSVPGSPANRCTSSEKDTANGLAVGDKESSAVKCVCLTWNLSPSRRHCVQVCVIVLRHCLPPLYSSDGDLCSCREHLPLVKELGVGPTAPVALSRGTVVCSALRGSPQALAKFLVQSTRLVRCCGVCVFSRDRRTHDP